MPKVSVIVPNYNHARYLEQRLQSILNQTYQDFEVIYLDDASTDNSNEVFAKFADHPKVRSIINTTNSGSPFKQWNKGIQHAKGDYIWIAESDDYAELTFLETLVPIMEANLNVGLAYCQSREVDAEGSQRGLLTWWTDSLSHERWNHDFQNNGTDECRNYLFFRNTIPNASAVLIRREMMESAGYAEESMSLCGDWITWIRVLLHSDIAYSAKALNYYRFHNSSVRAKASLNGTEIFERIKFTLLVGKEVGISDQVIKDSMNDLIKQWAVLLVQKKSTINLSQNLKIYNLAKTYNPAIAILLIKHISTYSWFRLQQKILRTFPSLSMNL